MAVDRKDLLFQSFDTALGSIRRKATQELSSECACVAQRIGTNPTYTCGSYKILLKKMIVNITIKKITFPYVSSCNM